MSILKKVILPFCFIVSSSINLFSQMAFEMDKKTISKTILENICDNELKWLRNEIYARHGYVFSNKEYQAYFEQFDWYIPQNNNKKIRLSQVELNNAFLLKNEEKKRNARTKAIISFLEDLKAGLIYNDSTIIQVLNKVDIYELKFCGKKNALVEYKVEGSILAENGKDRIIERRYSVSIQENTISIGELYKRIVATKKEGQFLMSPQCEYFEFHINSRNVIDTTPIIAACT